MTEPRIEPVEAPLILPRMGRGLSWSAITAEIEADRAEPSPDPLEAA